MNTVYTPLHSIGADIIIKGFEFADCVAAALLISWSASLGLFTPTVNAGGKLLRMGVNQAYVSVDQPRAAEQWAQMTFEVDPTRAGRPAQRACRPDTGQPGLHHSA